MNSCWKRKVFITTYITVSIIKRGILCIEKRWQKYAKRKQFFML